MTSSGPPKPWFIYVRVSTDDQAKGTSPEAQRDACHAMATALALEVADVVVDGGWSGKSLERPGIKRVLGAIDRGESAGVIVYKLDRLTRSRRDLEDLLDRFEKTSSGLISVSERLDTSSPNGRFFVAMLGAIAQWERETIAERVTMGIRHRKSQGGFVGGQVPAGLTAVGLPGKRELQAHPKWGPVVSNVWPQIVQGKSLRTVAEYLSKQEVPSGRGTKWTPTGARKLALSPRYLGILCTADQQERARAVLSSRFSPANRNGAAGKTQTHTIRAWLLSGIGRCGACDSALVGVTATNARGVAYPYYRCTGRLHHGTKKCREADLRAEPWEAAVVDSLVRSVSENGKLYPALAEVAAAKRELAAPLQVELEQLTMARDKLGAELGNLTEMAAQGGAVAQGLGAGIAARQTKVNELGRKIGRIEGELAAARMTADQADELARLLKDRIGVIADAPAEDQARDLKQLVASVKLRRNPVEKTKGEVDLAINLPRSAGPLFVSAWPMVEDGTRGTNTVGFTDVVELVYPTLRPAWAS